MCHNVVLSSRFPGSQKRTGNRIPFDFLFLFLGRSFLSRRFLRYLFLRGSLVGLRLYGYGLLCFGLFLRKLGSLEGLAIEGDFGDAHRAERLAMTAQLLVLLLALVVEDDDFRPAALFQHFAEHTGFGLRASNLALRARNRQNVVELDLAVGAELLHPNHVAGRHPVLLTTGADDRVHMLPPKFPGAHGRW